MGSYIELLTQSVWGSEHTTAVLPPSLNDREMAAGTWRSVKGKKPDGNNVNVFQEMTFKNQINNHLYLTFA